MHQHMTLMERPLRAARDSAFCSGLTMPRSRSSQTSQSSSESGGDGIDDLSFHQARTALELILAELQSGDLEVETMADLYRRAQLYADRCETVLKDVEQDVRRWDPQNPEMAPDPYSR